MLVFLGGTCGNNNWRDGFIERLVARGVPAEILFNPVVEVWDAEAQRREDEAKVLATWNLFYLGDPKMQENRSSLYSAGEAIMGMYDDPARTLVIFDDTGMPDYVAKSSRKLCADLQKRFPKGKIFADLQKAEDWIVSSLPVPALT